MKLIGEFIYTGFTLNLIAFDSEVTRYWTPNEGDYKKNLFACYIYRGTMYEYRSSDNMLDNTYKGEIFINYNVTLDYSTYEHFDNDTTWLCFSSWKPIESTFFRLDGLIKIPAGTGVFCVLGIFNINDNGKILTARALHYVKPRDYDIEIEGNAKILLFTNSDKFVNKPSNT